MRDYHDDDFSPETELIEMRLQQQRRKRVIAAIAVVVIVAMIGLFALSDFWRAARNRPVVPDQIEFVET
jgi:hypothetical protein